MSEDEAERRRSTHSRGGLRLRSSLRGILEAAFENTIEEAVGESRNPGVKLVKAQRLL
jgi:hypothetical protein